PPGEVRGDPPGGEEERQPEGQLRGTPPAGGGRHAQEREQGRGAGRRVPRSRGGQAGSPCPGGPLCAMLSVLLWRTWRGRMSEPRTRDEAVVKIACVQMEPVVGQKERNVRRTLEFIEQAAANGAHLVVLPELCNSGYVFESR